MANEFKKGCAMNYKVGRNDTCPCGSGKKYKKCCIEEGKKNANNNNTPLDFEWHQLRTMAKLLIERHLLVYLQELPAELLGWAIEDFISEGFEDLIDQRLMKEFFLPWFLFSWIPLDDFDKEGFDPDKTLAHNYMYAYGNRLKTQEKRFIEAMSQSYYSFYSIQHVEKDRFVFVKDIMLGTTYQVKEKEGTRYLKRGNIIFALVLTLDNQSIFVGMVPFMIPASYQNDLIDFRQWMIERNDHRSLDGEVLRNEFAEVMLNYLFGAIKIILKNHLPILSNTDGEPIQFSKTYFKLEKAPESVVSDLLPLTTEEDPNKILQNAKRDKAGKIKKIELTWVKKGNNTHKNWDHTVLGQITLEPGPMIL